MCEPSSWTYAAYAAAAAMAAYGANEQAKAQNEAADRQAAALNAAMEQQDQWSKKSEQKAMDNAQEYDMGKRTQRLEDTQQAATDTLTNSLVKSREEIGAPDVAEGKLSDAFTADRAQKMSDQFQKSVDMARLMGKMRGVQDMLGNEAITNADYASQLNTIGRNAKGDYSAAQPGIAQAGKVNAGQMTMGALAQSLGTSYLMSGALSGLGGGAGAGAGADVGNGAGNANLMANGNSVGNYANLRMM